MKIDLLVHNGNVITCDVNYKKITGFTVQNGQFLSIGKKLGNNFEAKQVLDLEGKTVVPGLFDGHTHLSKYGIFMKSQLSLEKVKSREEFLEIVETKARTNPEEWLIAYGWDESKWDNPKMITLEEFDVITSDTPAVATRIDGHTTLVNTKAFELISVPLEHVGVEKDTNGQITGYLKDIDFKKRMPKPHPQLIDEALLEVCYFVNSLGITSACDMTGSVEPDDTIFRRYIASYFRMKDKITVRVCLYPSYRTIDQLAETGLGPVGDDKVRICGQKLFLDGSFGGKTAAINKGYDDGSKGLDLNPKAGEMVIKATSAGWQTTIHAIGDRAIARAVDIIEDSGMHGQRIEHAEYLDTGLLDRLFRAEVFLSMQPNFNTWAHKGGLYENRIGEDRLKLNPFRKVVDSGITLAFGSDCMPLDPWLGIHHAVNHPVPDFALTVEQAITAYTLGSARATGVSKKLGSITPNKLADFVIIDKDPFDINKSELKNIKVIKTFLGGKQVYPK
ncbi:MAG: amidohydrolase [Candidatus Hodarchaeales archaeon]